MLLPSMLLLVLSDHMQCLWRRKVLGLMFFVQTVLVRLHAQSPFSTLIAVTGKDTDDMV
jgi:hypothetical protein